MITEQTPPADVTDFSGNTGLGDSTDTAPETPASTNDAPAKPTGFSGLFSQAKTAALNSRESEDDPGTKDDTADDEPDADEQIPAGEEDAAESEDKAKTDDKAQDKPDEPESEPKQTARSQAFKDVQAENARLQTEATEAATRLSKLDQQFEEHGGVDVVETAMALFDKVSKGDTVGMIEDLPPHEQAKVTDAVLTRALEVPEVRVASVNKILKADFGLEKELSQSTLEKLFEVATYRSNFDPDEFEAFLDREIEMVETPETQLEKANRKIAELSQPKTEEPQQLSDMDLSMQANQLYDELELNTYQEVAGPVLAEYGLDIKPGDSASVKAAKEILLRAIDDHVGVEIRKAKAFEPLLPYLLSGDKNYAKNPFYTQGVKAYSRAMKAKVQGAAKAVSVLLGGGVKTPPKDPTKDADTSTAPGQRLKVPAPDGKRQISTPKEQPKKGGGFATAFGAAKKNVGVG